MATFLISRDAASAWRPPRHRGGGQSRRIAGSVLRQQGAERAAARWGGLPPVFEMETLKLAGASASIDHPFLAEYVTNAFSIGRHTRTGGPEAISHVSLDRKHAIDVAHGVPLSAKPIAYRLAAVLRERLRLLRRLRTSSIFLWALRR